MKFRLLALSFALLGLAAVAGCKSEEASGSIEPGGDVSPAVVENATTVSFDVPKMT